MAGPIAVLPATMLAVSLAQLAQTGAQAAGGAGYRAYNSRELRDLLARRARGEWLTPEEEEAIRSSAVTPAAQAATESARRAEQIQAAAYSRGGSSGAQLAEIRRERSRGVAQAQAQGQAALAAARVAGRQAVEQEIEDRQAQRSAMNAELAGAFGNQISQVAATAGKIAGAPPGYWQAARMYGLPSRDGLRPVLDEAGKVMGYEPVAPAAGEVPAVAPTGALEDFSGYRLGITSQQAVDFEQLLNYIATDPRLRFYLATNWGKLPPFDPNALPSVLGDQPTVDGVLER